MSFGGSRIRGSPKGRNFNEVPCDLYDQTAKLSFIQEIVANEAQGSDRDEAVFTYGDLRKPAGNEVGGCLLDELG